MKKKYCKVEIDISDDYDDVLLLSPGIILPTEDGHEENAVDDIFSGWWL